MPSARYPALIIGDDVKKLNTVKTEVNRNAAKNESGRIKRETKSTKLQQTRGDATVWRVHTIDDYIQEFVHTTHALLYSVFRRVSHVYVDAGS